MKKLAIIPARGGSKRIPRKNIKPFLGKPIIAYPIEAALASGLFDEVMVSTDDEEIASISESFGAKVPFRRSQTNADDFATTVDVLLEVLQAYRDQGELYDFGCCIYPTAPFITSDLLKKSFQKLMDEKLDVVFPIMKFGYPIQRALKMDKDEKVEMFYPHFQASRSQDLETAYHDSGQFYWFDSQILCTKKKLWTNNTGAIVLNEMEAHDIDSNEDWKLAELKFTMISDGKTN